MHFCSVPDNPDTANTNISWSSYCKTHNLNDNVWNQIEIGQKKDYDDKCNAVAFYYYININGNEVVRTADQYQPHVQEKFVT